MIKCATRLIEYYRGYKYRRLLRMRGHMTCVNRKNVSASHIAPEWMLSWTELCMTFIEGLGAKEKEMGLS